MVVYFLVINVFFPWQLPAGIPGGQPLAPECQLSSADDHPSCFTGGMTALGGWFAAGTAPFVPVCFTFPGTGFVPEG